MHSFIAFIDESGDDGLKKFQTIGHTGASNWLVISCCVVRYNQNLELVKLRNSIKDSLVNGQRKDIHFSDLKHNQKIMACQKIAAFPLRGISILSNKTYIPRGHYVRKNQLYHYITRYLIERLSWFCRDKRPSVPEGNGQVKIVFSKRGGMDYQNFQDYLRHLKSQSSQNNQRNNIHWPVIDIDSVEAQDHSKLAGLQIADCISSACRSAVDPDIYGNCESRYAKELKNIIYKRGNYLSYGLKILPALEEMNLTNDQKEFFNFFQ